MALRLHSRKDFYALLYNGLVERCLLQVRLPSDRDRITDISGTPSRANALNRFAIVARCGST
jgi:hypothetical protein